MTFLFLDVECTILNKGNPFTRGNSLVCVGVREDDTNHVSYDFSNSYRKWLQEKVNNSIVVTFNGKFDLHWIRNIGIDVSNIRIWDCQLAEFLFSCQTKRFPSLDDTLEKYGFPLKLDIVKTEYWDKGICTSEIPRDTLTQYLIGDLEKTEQVFKQQWYLFHSAKYKHLYPLFKIQCSDLLVLEEMEYNGIYFNIEEARKRANEIQEKQKEISESIFSIIGECPLSLTSDRDISTMLYGGTYLEEVKIPIGVFKSGAKVGQTRYKNVFKSYEFPRLVEPLEKSQVKIEVSKKELELVEKGVLKEPRKQWAVNEDTLKQVKAKGNAKKIIQLILEFNKIEKLRTTYFEGWSSLNENMDWPHNMLHGQFNQCVATTGRLSSSNPNNQNPSKEVKQLCETRYE